jgi:hypothetical protein
VKPEAPPPAVVTQPAPAEVPPQQPQLPVTPANVPQKVDASESKPSVDTTKANDIVKGMFNSATEPKDSGESSIKPDFGQKDVAPEKDPVNFVDPYGLCAESGNTLWNDIVGVFRNGTSEANLTIDLVLGRGVQINLNNKGGSILPAEGLMLGISGSANRSGNVQGVNETLNLGLLFSGYSVSQDSLTGNASGYGTSAGKGLVIGVSRTREGGGYGRSWSW